MSKSNIEGVSKEFNLETYLRARELTIKIVEDVSKRVEVGMSEFEGVELLKQVSLDHGIEKTWHPYKFRIGKNTLKSFSEKSDPGVTLKGSDIYFVDVGLVVDGYETDIGRTFVLGHDSEFLGIQNNVNRLFLELNEIWNEQLLSGKALYDRAIILAESYGYILNLKMDGHRLSEFPHGVYYKGGLAGIDFTPVSNLWVLELLIRDVYSEFGAFYEDILISGTNKII